MTRKQAFLVLLIALLILAGRQHIQWPSRFWESPSFETLDWDKIAKRFSAEEPTPETPVTEASIEKDPSPPPQELKPPEKKPEEKPARKEAKKPPKKKTASKAQPKAAPARTAAGQPEPKSVPLRYFPTEDIERVSACWRSVSVNSRNSGTIRVQYSHDKEGSFQSAQVIEDTLGEPVMVSCVVGVINSGNIALSRFDPDKAGVWRGETKIVFEPHKDPT